MALENTHVQQLENLIADIDISGVIVALSSNSVSFEDNGEEHVYVSRIQLEDIEIFFNYEDHAECRYFDTMRIIAAENGTSTPKIEVLSSHDRIQYFN